MPPLRAHRRLRRDRRARAPKVRRRRNLTKFVPSSDSDFAMTARGFADYVWKHRDELGVPEREAEYLGRVVGYFREALAKATSPLTRTTPAIRGKDDWRKQAEQQVRMIGGMIRTDPYVDQSHKKALRLIDLPPRKKESKCPQRPPVLQFMGTGDGVDGAVGAGNGSGVHVLKVGDRQNDPRKPDYGIYRKARPDGATGIELWVGFIPEGMRVPSTVQEYFKMGFGWPLFLRPYTTHTVEAKFPMPDRPMLIVYWARWTNMTGDQGRFCKTCVARVEGWSKSIGVLPEQSQAARVRVQHGAQHALPAGPAFPTMETRLLEAHRMQASFMVIGTPLALPAGDDADADDDRVVVLDERTLLPGAVAESSMGPSSGACLPT